MKWLFIFNAMALALAGCGSASKHDSSSSPPAAPAPAMAPPVANDNPDKVTCAKGTETRLLEVVKKDKGCAFAYTKFGKTSDAATSSHGLKHCQASQKKVRGKLESAGYTCKP